MGGFTPYEKCNMLCINRLQFHSPIYSAGGRATSKATGKGTGRVTGRVTGKVHRQGAQARCTGKGTGKGAEIGVGKRCGEEVWMGCPAGDYLSIT